MNERAAIMVTNSLSPVRVQLPMMFKVISQLG